MKVVSALQWLASPLNGQTLPQTLSTELIKSQSFEACHPKLAQVGIKGWLAIAKLKPLVDRYSCQPIRSLDTSNNLSVGPSCM